MLYDVIDAIYKGDYRIELKFEDGVSGTIDFTKYTKMGGVFENMKNMEYFRSFKVNPDIGTITWPDDVDIAPDTLYVEVTGTKQPWMK